MNTLPHFFLSGAASTVLDFGGVFAVLVELLGAGFALAAGFVVAVALVVSSLALLASFAVAGGARVGGAFTRGVV